MDYKILKDDIINDPLVRGYSGMTDTHVADDLNSVYRTRNRDQIPGSEILDETDWVEYGALTDLKKSQWLSFTSADFVSATKAGLNILRDIFGTGTTTEDNLLLVRAEDISRATELGLSIVREGDVEYARTL